ncbi:MAG: tyrosine-type recombinase/integrase [Candidatus Dojkabacteria bacterium]|nr:tyrosine-type recombinase/integrase [Candidatus Dojkabacteria bacterium]
MKKKILPYLDDYLLELSNNNYSLETIKNYERDLLIFKEFLTLKNISFKQVSKKTITLYKGFLKSENYFKFLEEIGEKSLDDSNISKSSSKGSKTHERRSRGLSSRSINRMLSSLRSFLRFLIDFDHRTPLAPDAIKLLKTERKESRVAEFEDLVKLVEYPTSFEKKKIVALRNRAILELLFSSGMRISELVNLNLKDVDLTFDRRKIRVGKLYILGKGKKQRFVYLTERCKSHLEAYLGTRSDQYEALFIPTKGKRIKKEISKVRISARYIQNRIALYRKLLGIIVPVSPHSLRHGFATYLAEKGASPVAIQRLLGHESLQTTTRYVHASDRFAEKTHKKYHPLSR